MAIIKAKKLSRDRIVDTALRIVRREGADSLTTRRIATELGVGVSSLYRHISDRDDILLAMLDHVALRLTTPPRNPDPMEELRVVFLTLHDTFAKDPWVVDLLLEKTEGSSHIAPLIERVFEALHNLNTSPGQAWSIYRTIICFLFGYVLMERGKDARTTHERNKAQDASGLEQFPYLRQALFPEHVRRPDAAYAILLESLLKGIISEECDLR